MAAPRGLSDDDIETLRTAVSAGRRPKVVFTASAGQMAGQTGQVTALGAPTDGDEWISVKFGRDKLEFAPTDLQLPGKAAPPRRAAKTSRPPATSPASAAPAAAAAPADTPTSSTPTSQTRPPAPPQPEPTAPRPARRTGRGKGPADLSVTLTWQDGDWTVQAHRGAKVLAKPAPVRAADALRMVGLLDVPTVADAVGEIVTAARTAAADRAEQLRRELADVEARLAELPELD